MFERMFEVVFERMFEVVFERMFEVVFERMITYTDISNKINFHPFSLNYNLFQVLDYLIYSDI